MTPKETSTDSFTAMLYLAILSNMTNAAMGLISTLVQSICTGLHQLYVYLYGIFLDKVYGPKLEIHDSLTTSIPDYYPEMATSFIKYLEESHKIIVKSYSQKYHGNIAPKAVTYGNKMIGIIIDNIEIKREQSIHYTNSYTFYTRLHSKEAIKELVKELYMKTFNFVTKECIIIRDQVPNHSANTNYYPLKSVPEKIFIPEIYAELKKIVSEKDQANVILHGPPGTGKTNIIKKLTHDLEAALFIINPAKFESIEMLRNYMSRESYRTNDAKIITSNRKFFLFEDFDTTLPESFWKHEETPEDPLDAEDAVPKKSSKKTTAGTVQYTYSDLLNLLDGVIKMTNVYIFFTTNHLEKFPKSFYRPGRMHYNACIDLLTINQMAQFVEHYYGPIKDSKKASGNNTNLKKLICRRATISEMYATKDLSKGASDFIEKINKKYLESLEK